MNRLVDTVQLGIYVQPLGVEIHADVVQHAKSSMQRWKSSRPEATPHIEWIHGNALNINPGKGEAAMGFDRIYVGASVEKENLHKLTCLLRPGGILVGPGMLSCIILRSFLTCSVVLWYGPVSFMTGLLSNNVLYCSCSCS